MTPEEIFDAWLTHMALTITEWMQDLQEADPRGYRVLVERLESGQLVLPAPEQRH